MNNTSQEGKMEHLPKNWKKQMFKIIKKYSKDKAPQSIIIASGGTGGHIFPAQSIAEILSNRYKIVWITDERGYIFLSKDPMHKKYVFRSHQLLSGPLQGNAKNRLYSLIKTALGTMQAAYYIIRYKPVIIVGFGGYASVPILLAAVLRRVPIVLHEQNAVLGQVNRLFARFAKCIILGFPRTQKLNKKYSEKALFLGNPIRNNVWECGQSKRNKKKSDYIKLLVIGGSQGAKIFCEKIPRAIEKLPLEIQKKLIIKQQTLAHNVSDVRTQYEKMDVKDVEISPFFNNIGEIMQESDVIIARAGASTIAEIEYFKLPALLIPFAAAKDNHQYYNAKYLVEKNLALMLEEREINDIRKLVQTLELLFDHTQLEKMRDKANIRSNEQVASKIAVKINQLLM